MEKYWISDLMIGQDSLFPLNISTLLDFRGKCTFYSIAFNWLVILLITILEKKLKYDADLTN